MTGYTEPNEKLNRENADLKLQVAKAKAVLIDGLKYYEHDGHDLPKKVVRDALSALGVDRDNQP
jgi:hypothetical protein